MAPDDATSRTAEAPTTAGINRVADRGNLILRVGPAKEKPDRRLTILCQHPIAACGSVGCSTGHLRLGDLCSEREQDPLPLIGRLARLQWNWRGLPTA